MRTVIEDAGLALIALGVALVYTPAGVIAAGLLIVLAANTHDGIRRHRTPAPPCGESGQHDQHLFGNPPVLCPGVDSA